MASMSPSLMVEIGANVAKLRTDMDRSINEISRLRRESDNHAKAMKATFEGSIAGISSAFVVFAAKATAAIYTVRQAWNFAKGGAEIEETKGILDNLARKYQTTSDSMVKSMREASQGLIADSNLASIALGGLAKGLKPEQMINLASAAALLGDTVGKNATEAFNDLSEALESGRAKALKGFAGATIDLKDTFGDLTDRLTGAEKAQAMYALVMIHATKLQKDQTAAVSDTADQMERIEAKWKNTTDTIRTYAMRATVAVYKFGLEINKWGSYLWRDEEGYKQSDAKLRALEGSGKSPVGTGVGGKSDSIAEYQKQIAEMKKLLQSRSDVSTAEKKSVTEAAKAVKEAEREKQEAIDLTTKAIAAEYEAVDQIIKDVNAGAQESLDSIIKQFEEVSRLYDDMTAKIEAANQQTIMGAFAGTGMGGPMGDLMSIISDTSVFDEAISTIEEYYSRRGDLASDLAAKEAAIEQANWQKKTAMVSYGFASMSALAQAFYNASNQRSKAAFTLYKAFAAAEATVDTYRAAQASYAWAASGKEILICDVMTGESAVCAWDALKTASMVSVAENTVRTRASAACAWAALDAVISCACVIAGDSAVCAWEASARTMFDSKYREGDSAVCA